ncbi:MAG: hypothetical protein AAGC97_06220 [Planctomycetota bacterium]
MSLTSQVVASCLIIPALIAGIFAWATGWFARRVRSKNSDGSDPARPNDAKASNGLETAGGIIAEIGWCMAMMAAMGMRQWVGSETGLVETIVGVESWQRTIWPMMLFGIVLSIGAATQPDRGASRYALAGLTAALAAFMTLPSGENWSDQLPLHRSWSGLMVASCLANAWALESLVRQRGDRWCLLVLLAGFATPAMLTALNYAAPAEWVLASIAATVGATGVIAWQASRGAPSAAWMVVFPGCVVIASMTMTARFYTYEDYPRWVYSIALFLPAMIRFIDLPIQSRSWRLRVPVAALVAIGLMLACANELILSEPTENW